MHDSSRWKIQKQKTIKNTNNKQTKRNTEKQTKQNTAKQNYPGLFVYYNTRPGNEVGLFYNAPERTHRHNYICLSSAAELSSNGRQTLLETQTVYQSLRSVSAK